jgi:hypothetical protein
MATVQLAGSSLYLCHGLICCRPIRGSALLDQSIDNTGDLLLNAPRLRRFSGARSRRLHAWLSNATAPPFRRFSLGRRAQALTRLAIECHGLFPPRTLRSGVSVRNPSAAVGRKRFKWSSSTHPPRLTHPPAGASRRPQSDHPAYPACPGPRLRTRKNVRKKSFFSSRASCLTGGIS